MTIKDFLADESNIVQKNQCFVLRKGIELNNGVKLSVHASTLHMCFPRDVIFDGSYDAVEICSSKDIDAFSDYKDQNTEFNLYTYVPVCFVDEYIKTAGGVKCLYEK